jgi:short subunit dehydrogenase-like uncharacterized protein
VLCVDLAHKMESPIVLASGEQMRKFHHHFHLIIECAFCFLVTRFDKIVKSWTMPFIMAAVNTRVVRRSASLLANGGDGAGYGPNFAYNE